MKSQIARATRACGTGVASVEDGDEGLLSAALLVA